MANTLSQISAVTGMNLRAIPSRIGTSMVIVIGIAGVVGVLVALLSMGRGFEATLASTGSDDRALVLRQASTDELSSVVTRDHAQIIAETEGVRRDAEGKPIALFEFYLITDVAKKGDSTPNNVVVRGTTENVFDLRTEASIVEGRMFTPGVREVVVGKGAQTQFSGLGIGQTVDVRDGPWTIVGVFESNGDVHESELWVDGDALATASKRTAFNTVTVQLESKESLQPFKDALSTDPRLKVFAQSEPAYYASRSKALNSLIKYLGYSVAVIMAIGALFGALNTMYAAVATRTTEIATLRALGFGGFAVVISVLIEALFLAFLGGVLGGVIAFIFFNGFTVNTLNFQTFSQVAFQFRVTPDLLTIGIKWALFIGFFGGLFPALRAARMPVAEALRAG